MKAAVSLIQPLALGGETFPHNVIQGPLAGVSSAPFRFLVWKYGKPIFSYTEMIACKTIIHGRSSDYQRYLSRHPEEGPVGVQLSGTCPIELAEAVKIVTDNGANLIDLNCGCPVKKIRRKGAGSKLLADSLQLFKLMTALKRSTHVPVSIKIRVDDESDSFNQSVAAVIADAGIDFVIVHGRHWTEQYETPCRYSAIQFFVEQLTIPVIGNGDIACADSLHKMLLTGCAGVMVSRASVGRPWLIQKMLSEINKIKFTEPARDQIITIFFEHVTMLADLLGSESLALFQSRRFAKYYFQDQPDQVALCEVVFGCQSLAELSCRLDRLMR